MARWRTSSESRVESRKYETARRRDGEDGGENDMDITTIAAFAGFFAMVLAWLAAPTDAKRPTAAMIDPITVGAD
jgi:hypothetical protein